MKTSNLIHNYSFCLEEGKNLLQKEPVIYKKGDKTEEYHCSELHIKFHPPFFIRH